MKLTNEQKQIVYHKDEHLAVLACPGSGKTTVILERIEYLIKYQNVHPQTIALITFTRRVAEELKNKVLKIDVSETQFTINDLHKLTVSTIDSFSLQLLKKYVPTFGKFQLISDLEEKLLFYDGDFYHACMGSFKSKGKKIVQVSAVFDYIYQKYPHYDVELEDNQVNWEQLLADNKNLDAFSSKWQGMVTTEEKAMTIKERIKDVTHQFMSKQLLTHDLVKAELCKYFQNAKNVAFPYQYVFIDEFQDVSLAQWLITSYFTKMRGIRQVMVVGDPNQAIYGFRGGTSKYLVEFTDQIIGAWQLALTTNFRSNQKIIALANLWTENSEAEATNMKSATPQVPIGVSQIFKQKYDIEWICKKIATNPHHSIAIMCATNTEVHNVEKFVKRQQRKNLDYVTPQMAVVKSMCDFFVSYIYFLASEDSMQVESQLKKHFTKIFASTVEIIENGERVSEVIQEKFDHFWKIIQTRKNAIFSITKRGLDEAINELLLVLVEVFGRKYVNDIYKLFSFLTDVIAFICNNTLGLRQNVFEKLMQHIKMRKFSSKEAHAQRLENLVFNEYGKYFSNYIFKGSNNHIWRKALTKMSIRTNTSQVVFLTYHQAKGLEFDIVILPQFGKRTKGSDIIEERFCLNYVAMTRAKKEIFAFLSNGKEGMSPSLLEPVVKEFYNEKLVDSDFLFDSPKMGGLGNTEQTQRKLAVDASYSCVSTLNDCYNHFLINYEMQFAEMELPSKEVTMGRKVHEFLANINNTIDDETTILNYDYQQFLPKLPHGVTQEIFGKIFDWYKAFLKDHYKRVVDDEFSIDYKRETPLRESDDLIEFNYWGIVDALLETKEAGVYEVIEFKTINKKKPASLHLKEYRSQLSFYAWLLNWAHPLVKKVNCRIIFFEIDYDHDYELSIDDQYSYEIDNEEDAKINEWLQNFESRFAKGMKRNFSLLVEDDSGTTLENCANWSLYPFCKGIKKIIRDYQSNLLKTTSELA